MTNAFSDAPTCIPAAFSLALLLALILPGPTAAETVSADEVNAAAEALPLRDRHLIAADPDGYLDRVTQYMRLIGEDERVTAEDFQRIETVRRAQGRAERVARWLRRDLDGDGRITREEFLEGASGGDASAEFGDLIGGADADWDGALDLDEMTAAARWLTDPADAGVRGAYQIDLHRFDVDGDGAVTVAEVRAVVGAAAEAAAAAAREPPSSSPMPPPKPSLQAPRQSPDQPSATSSTAPGCTLPERPVGSAVVVLTGTRGAGLSNVAVSGPDQVTTVATVEVEPGDTPLYVFASAVGPTIWRVGGDTGRIARFVAQPQRMEEAPGTAVLGLPRDVVDFLPRDACAVGVARAGTVAAQKVAKRFAALLEVDPDEVTVIGHGSLDTVSIPSGSARLRGIAKSRGAFQPGLISRDSIVFDVRGGAAAPGSISAGVAAQSRKLPISREAPPLGRAATEPAGQWKATAKGRLDHSLRQSFPDGVVEVDPAGLIAPGPVAAYDVLPAQAGMIQLIEAGAMRETQPGTYLLVRQVARFPAGFSEAPHVKIVIDEGVPVPKGQPGQTKVYLRETGACILGPDCR